MSYVTIICSNIIFTLDITGLAFAADHSFGKYSTFPAAYSLVLNPTRFLRGKATKDAIDHGDPGDG